MRAVAFDFDGTLTRGDSTKHLMAALLRGRPLGAVRLLAMAVQFRLGRLSPQEFKNGGLGRLIRGRCLEDVQSAAQTFAVWVMPTLRKSIMDRVRAHIEKGDVVIVATASPTFAIASVFAGDNVHVIGTEFEVAGKSYTGNCLGNCFGEEKARRIREFLGERQISSLACAYSDHHSDAPMFRLAERCALVHPNEDTKRLLTGPRFSIVE